MEAQGYGPEENELNQDNKATILLEENGKSSSKRTRALDIRYFFLKDQIKSGNISVKYCPTECMIADYMTKPLQGKLCLLFKDVIMGKRGVKDVDTLHTRSVLEKAKRAKSRMSHGRSPGEQTDTQRMPNQNLNYDLSQKDFRTYNYFAILGE